MADEATWKRRFLMFSAVRLFGLGVFLLGMAIAYSDIVRDGGWPLLGGIIAVMGGIDAIFAPKLLRKHWAEQDRQNP
jgi:hypothetical protein